MRMEDSNAMQTGDSQPAGGPVANMKEKQQSTSSNLSELVKEMVKEMDANEFYSKTDLYDDSLEVRTAVQQHS